MSTAAADGYEGGVGGKLRRKLPRRAAATPYDRPPVAGRGLRGAGIETSLSLVEGGRRRGWLSKLVDPASTLITKGATRLFSSVFRKRLGAPPAAESPVQTLESGEVVADAFDSNPLLNTQERETNDVQDIHDGSDISEFELLLKQKTFTRDEYDRLTELLRSRTVDISNEEDVRRTRQSTSTPAMDYSTPETENFTSQISEEELASPAEVAKAYMGSRPSKVSPSSLSLRSQVLRETTTVSPTFAGFTPKLMAPPLPSKSVVQFPGLRAAQDNGCTTPVSRGRSAIYRMSRSPYFRAPPTIPIKEDGKIDDVHAGPSQWTPRSLALSSSKQVLKRRSTVLESNIGSVGPIRRIRQKSNLFTPMTSPSNTTELSSSKSKIETLENGEKRSDYVPVPTQSREMAKKILQQLDKLVPSPKDKPSETKTVFRDESPSKLTVNMLHGQALKSFTEKDLSKLFNAEANGPVPSTKSQLEFSVLSTDSIIRSKAASEAQMMETVAETRVVEPLPKKSFKMQVPVELLDHDNDDFPGRDDSNAFTAKKPFFAASQISEVKLSRTLTTNGLEVAKKDTGFTFPVSLAPAIDTHLPPTPTMPSAPTLSAGADTMPVFSFSSKTAPLTFSSTLANSAAASETKQQSPENRSSISTLEKSEKTREPGFLFKSAPTTSNTTSLFGGSFTSTTQSNGSPLPMTPSLFSPPSPVAFTTPSFQFSTPTSKDSAPQPAESVFGLRAKDSESKPSRESVFSMPTSATTTTTTDFASKPSNDSIFSLPTSTTLATDFAPKPSKDSLFSLPTSTPITTTGTDFAPKPLKESIFSLPTSTSMTSAGDFTSKPSKESMFTLPPPAATTMSTATDFAQKPSKESVFSLSTSAPMTTTVSTGFTPIPSKESIFSLPASTDSTPKPASESIFGLSTSTTTSAPTFSSGVGSIFGGTGASSLFSQSTASQFTPSGSSNSSIFGTAASSQSAAMPSSIFGSSFGAASSAPAFSYHQAAAPASPPVFGFSSPFKVASASPGNDQMSVEDSMADDSVVAAPTPAVAPSMPVFGGTTATPVFPFGSPQPVTFMPNPQPPFQTGAATEFQGNFSMGSGGGGGDKSGRRFIKAKRDKHRKK